MRLLAERGFPLTQASLRRLTAHRTGERNLVLGVTGVRTGVLVDGGHLVVLRATREQLAFLKARSCDEGQGYYLGRPVVAEVFAELLCAPLRPPFASEQVSALGAR